MWSWYSSRNSKNRFEIRITSPSMDNRKFAAGMGIHQEFKLVLVNFIQSFRVFNQILDLSRRCALHMANNEFECKK